MIVTRVPHSCITAHPKCSVRKFKKRPHTDTDHTENNGGGVGWGAKSVTVLFTAMLPFVQPSGHD